MKDYHPKASLDTNPGEGAAKQSGAASSALCEVGIGVEQTLTTATADRTSDRSTISGAGVTGLREAVEAESRQDQAEPCNSALPSILPVPVLAELPYKSSVVEGIAHGVSPKDAKGSAQRESTPKPGPSTVIGGSRGGQNQFPVHATEPHPSASNEARRVGDFLI